MFFAMFFLFIGPVMYGQNRKEEKVDIQKKVLHLYPDTAKTYVNVYVELPETSSFSLSVYDYRYQTWIKDVKVVDRKSYQYNLDVTKLEDGRYKVLLKANNEQWNAEFSVRH